MLIYQGNTKKSRHIAGGGDLGGGADYTPEGN